MRPKIVVDNKIPFVRGILESFAEVQYLPANDINNACLHDVDVLFIRTRTHCNEVLLHDTKVKYIFTATIGYDHIDEDYCRLHNIFWTNAPGCNALAVQQYVASVLAHFVKSGHFSWADITLGIVGVGHVGKMVLRFCQAMGIRTLLCDPFAQLNDTENQYVTIDEIAQQCNVITFHTPLTFQGEHPTYHMVNEDFLRLLKQRPVLINAARGEVMDNVALCNLCNQNLWHALALDCWENEPTINRSLLAMSEIATPHIAGYSEDGKANASFYCLNKICELFHFDAEIEYPALRPTAETSLAKGETIADAFLKIYDIMADTRTLKESPKKFEQLRSEYPLRRDYSAHHLHAHLSSKEQTAWEDICGE